MVDQDRVVTFSIPPADTKARSKVAKIKEYCSKTGVSFSFLMIRAVELLHKEMKAEGKL